MEAAITPDQLQVRQVDHYQITWSENAPGEPGTFTIQLILDQGAQEYIVRPPVDDVDVLQELLRATSTLYFDVARKVLMFGTRPVGSA